MKLVFLLQRGVKTATLRLTQMTGSMTSQSMVMVDTLISKPVDWIVEWIESGRACPVHPGAQMLAIDRLNEYREVLEKGGHCPYTGQFIKHQ